MFICHPVVYDRPVSTIIIHPMTVYSYTRVSTTDQTVSNQDAEFVTAGYTIDASNQYADIGVSGSVPAADRPQWQALIAVVKSGDVVVCSKIDRLGRNAGDILSTVDYLAEKGIKLVVLQFGGTDFCSPTGRLLLTMLSAVASFERELIIERTKAGIERARNEGKHIGGHSKDRTEVLALLSDGLSVSAICRQTGITRQTITRWRDEAQND